MADKYPDGKLSPTDQGELEFKLQLIGDGRIILDWGKPVQWIAFNPSEARAIAAGLNRKAAEAEEQLKALKGK
jgi:hypothetical protein